MIELIQNALPGDHPWQNQIIWLDATDSTNTQAKLLARRGAPHGTVLMADYQTGGRGRLGRNFHSPAGTGIYMSLILRPDCRPVELMHLTCAVAVAVCDAVEDAVGLRPGVKWINDLVWEKRKLGGILTELGLKNDGTLDYAIVGVGINCCQKSADFPEDIRPIAASLEMAAGKSVDRAGVAAAMIEALEKMSRDLLTGQAEMLDRYRRDCVTIGQEISVIRGDSHRHGKAVGVDEEGGLLVTYPDGSTETVNSGEVSVRGMYGYV